MVIGGASRPISATAAPAAPCSRPPKMTARLTTFAPGRNWLTAKASLNSSAVIQRFSSTIVRRAHGSTPPKPCSAIVKKARKSSEMEGGGGGDESRSGGMNEVVAPLHARRQHAGRQRPAQLS